MPQRRNQASAPKSAIDVTKRVSLRMRQGQKLILLQAAALKHMNLGDFLLQAALREAAAVGYESGHLRLSKRDSLRVLDLLENPPPANAKLRAASKTLPPLI